jgi:hypothetical protein
MTYETAFSSRDDLNQYGNNALTLFALELRFGIEDIHTVAADSLTDGSDDKKCDLIYIEPDEKLAVIAQGYYSSDPDKREAPSNKASDLNTAAAWLLSRETKDLPDRIRPAAIQLRNALDSGHVQVVQFWYVHNLPESSNVKNELKTVQSNAYSSLKQLLGDSRSGLDVAVLEVGRNQLEDWYKSLTTPIQVTESFEITTIGGYSIDGTDWSSFVTAIPATWLYEIFNRFKRENMDLFSANIRGYLGSRQVDANINSGIKATASNDPDHFWAYNNGLTILTHQFNYLEAERKLVITGLSIVNGAQTTGAIGSLQESPSENAMIPARFIRCNNDKVIKKIIQYNNSQNQIEAPDFRSGDDIQKRLREEFKAIASLTYLGGRRGGYEDRIRRPSNLLPSDTAGQALAAFHGDPVTAYNEKSQIWISDSLYSKYFSDRTSAKHIVLCYSLLRAVEDKKRQLLTASSRTQLTDKQAKTLSFFRNRGATFLLTSAISASIEIIVEKAIPDKFMLAFVSDASPQDAIGFWGPIVNVSSAFVERLTSAIERGLNNRDKVNTVISEFTNFIDATQEPNKSIYSEFSGKVEI